MACMPWAPPIEKEADQSTESSGSFLPQAMEFPLREGSWVKVPKTGVVRNEAAWQCEGFGAMAFHQQVRKH